MKSLLKGQLIRWKDDRGFGFIKPNDGSKEVFLHISALKRAGRRPKVGDTILYERVVQPDGKVRAAKASIQGVAPQPLPSTRKKPRRWGFRTTGRRSRKWSLRNKLMGLAILTVTILFVMVLERSGLLYLIGSITQPKCTIKGNISVNTGKRLYHLPGMKDYGSTRIDPSKGEKWFCTEEEAKAQGWRKAPM